MTKNQPQISVVIPTLGRGKSLSICLESLANQEFKDFEVVVVNGGDLESIKDLISRYSKTLNITHVAQEGKNLVEAIIQGYELSRGEIFVRTDDDIKAQPQWLLEVANTFEFDDKAGGVTGPTVIPEECWESRDLISFNRKMRSGESRFWNLVAKFYHGYVMEGQPFAVSRFFRSGAFSLGSNYPECLEIKKPLVGDYLESCNWCCQKNLIEKIGGFDKSFVGAAEYFEADAVYKIKNLGYKMIFNPKAVLYHMPSKVGAFFARSGSYTRIMNFLNFYFRHIKPNNPDKFLRLLSYVLFQDAYYVYIFTRTGNIALLGCLPATLIGLAKNFWKMVKEKNG